MAEPLLLSVPDAAKALGISRTLVQTLIQEADSSRKSRWRFGREIIDLTPLGNSRRTLRINVSAVLNQQSRG
jgi:post-segregation antitoxin (ccd killing protein)